MLPTVLTLFILLRVLKSVSQVPRAVSRDLRQVSQVLNREIATSRSWREVIRATSMVKTKSQGAWKYSMTGCLHVIQRIMRGTTASIQGLPQL